MEPVIYKIQNHYDVARVANYLNLNHGRAAGEGTPLIVNIQQENPDRSHAQNRLYWKWLTQWAKHQGSDKNTEHLYFKKKFLSVIFYRDDVGQYRNTFDAVKVLKQQKHPMYQYVADGLNELISTTDASVAQFTEYLNDIHAFCNTQGCWLDTPEDLMCALEK
ncbi:hypothetical protein QE380_000182 [Acinetobacter baylyi]|uniref:NinB family protein n=1 Tax=Acinetobacter baylyi TaxID=202950 RepID=A0ABU0URT5_ACIBI|nr:hypothetical protein [Acinetobacter baylyi]MDQ1207259.1 hypothetical protein [Acinetobacter baylyi]MDR6105659.1 hypothetical protein [Acinetobacter baylyi]MDR6187620.1 hypothetical protein [Acinetobacter baylyi]